MRKFLSQFSGKIMGVISGFDRMIFRGTPRRLCYPEGMKKFLWAKDIPLKNFKEGVEGLTQQIKDGAEQAAAKAGVSIEYLSSNISKEKMARRILDEKPKEKRFGLICVLSAVEPCQTWRLTRSKKDKELKLYPVRSKCLHHYHYFMHPLFGFAHVRVQTWLPFSVQVYINGREFLIRALERNRLRFTRAANCLVEMASPGKAQELMDELIYLPWQEKLGDLVMLANPIIANVLEDDPPPYYWTVSQCEWASDVIWNDAKDLELILPSLTHHAMTDLKSSDIMRFLAQKPLHTNFKGEVVTSYKHRPEGIRIKHSVKSNSVKMYNKQGNVLRVETTINNPAEFPIKRKAHGDPKSERKNRPLRKSVVDIPARARIGQASNKEYLNAMAVIEDPTTVKDLVDPLLKPATIGGKQVRALRPWSDPDLPVLEAINRGEFVLQGFRNRDILPLITPNIPDDAKERRKLSARCTRELRLLRAHGLIEKVEGTHRYKVTIKGRESITAILATREASLCKLKQCA